MYFNTVWTRLLPPSDNRDTAGNFLASVNDLYEHTLQYVCDSEMVGITTQNHTKQSDKPIGISFRRKNQLSADAIWSVFGKVCQSNSRFYALDTLVVTALCQDAKRFWPCDEDHGLTVLHHGTP